MNEIIERKGGVIMTTLFDVPEVKKEKYTGKKCKNCDNLFNHNWGKMKYCSVKKQRNTSYGRKKIKANDEACGLFKEKERVL